MGLEIIYLVLPMLYYGLPIAFIFFIFKAWFRKKSDPPNYPLRIASIGTALIGGGYLAWALSGYIPHAHDPENMGAQFGFFLAQCAVLLISAYSFVHLWIASWALRVIYLYFIKRDEVFRRRSLVGIVLLAVIAFEIGGYLFMRYFR